MLIEEAIRILDPETTRDALLPYAYDPDRRIKVVTDACRIAAAALRAQQTPVKLDSSRREACGMCDSAFTNPELSSDNDLSYSSIGTHEDGYRMLLRSGWGKPVVILSEKWRGGIGWQTIGCYQPKFCPNCGRSLTENAGQNWRGEYREETGHTGDICASTGGPCCRCNPGPCDHRKPEV